MQEKVCTIVLNWNGWRDTSVCLSSLAKLDYKNQEVIVVDNGSTDDSVSRLRSEFPHVRLLETGCNLGFGAGCNFGIRYALAIGAPYVWLLNNDTRVEPQALNSLVEKANSDRAIGAVGSAIYSMREPQSLQAWGGGRVNFWLGRSRHWLKPVRDDAVDFITGASMLVSREALGSVGLLDEQFFMYWEDADFCFRLRHAKWKLAVAGDSKIWHKGSASAGKESISLDRYFNDSAARFFEKHAHFPTFTFWTGVTLRLSKRLLSGDWERARAVWVGASRF